MQITSTVSQHKMEPLNGNPNNSASSEPITHEDAEQVGGAFCHQFYITVSENRGAITRFYGHESIFQLDDKVVTGSGEIAKQYDLLPESTHFKIHSIRGLPTFHKQGVLVHVIGTVNLRPFVQTFVLGQQGQKKYYIEIDNFQYIDSFFENKPDADKPAATIAVNGHSNGVNGKVTKPAAKAPEPTPEPVKQQTPQKPQQTPKKAEEPRPAKQETPKSAEKENKAPKQHQQQQHQPQQQHQQAPAPAPIPEPAQVPVQIHEAPKPKTWANLVRGGNQQPPQPNFNQVHQQQLHQHQMQAAAILHQQAAQQQAAQQHAIYQQAQRVREQHAAIIQHQAQLHQPAADPQQQQQGGEDAASLLERKIYLGGITREIVPSNTAQAETEIKQVFYKYGEVEEVRMPRKVLDSPNDTSKHAFAFITMRTKQGVQAIFNGATRDEAGVWKLPLKLDAFGFDGLAQISEQRDQPPGGAFRGGRGGGGGGGGGFGNRGGYFRRGGATGGAPRGMQRGGFQNNSMNNGH